MELKDGELLGNIAECYGGPIGRPTGCGGSVCCIRPIGCGGPVGCIGSVAYSRPVPSTRPILLVLDEIGIFRRGDF